LNSLPEVKRFVREDIPLYHNVQFKSVPGAPPKLLLLNKDDRAVEKIDLAPHSQSQCNDLLLKRGFYKKKTAEEEVPEQYREGPYVLKSEL